MFISKKKNLERDKGKRFLISITVFGSTGPIRFVVYEKETVADVIDSALKFYAYEGRLPILGSEIDDFVLYCPLATTSEALAPSEAIGTLGFRNFMLCKKPQAEKSTDSSKVNVEAKTNAGNWKNWFNKALSHKVSSH